jgi:hypothetical protein
MPACRAGPRRRRQVLWALFAASCAKCGRAEQCCAAEPQPLSGCRTALRSCRPPLTSSIGPSAAARCRPASAGPELVVRPLQLNGLGGVAQVRALNAPADWPAEARRLERECGAQARPR